MTKRRIKKCLMFIALAVVLCMTAGCAGDTGADQTTVSNDEKTAQAEATVSNDEKTAQAEATVDTSDDGGSTTVTTKFQRVYTMTNMEDFKDEYYEYAPVFVVDYAPDEGWVQFDASSWLYPNSYFSTTYPVQSGDYYIKTFGSPEDVEITPIRLEYSDDSFTIAYYYTEYDSDLGEDVKKLGILSKFVWTE